MKRFNRWLRETFRLNYLLGAHSPSLFWLGRCRCLFCRRAARKARNRRQCWGPVYVRISDPTPGRCVLDLGHEGGCEL